MVPLRIELPTLKDAKIAQALQAARGIRSEATEVQTSTTGGNRKVFLKLENELLLGSYKLRGVINALDHHHRQHGKIPKRMITVSAGNMAQAVAYIGKEINCPVKAIVPESAPRAKTDVIRAFGGDVEIRPMTEVWNYIENPLSDPEHLLIHPLVTPGILAGYSVIALEILEMPVRPDALFIPFGVGGLTIGIASILKMLAPEIAIICVETEACPTLQSAFQAGKPVYVTKGHTCADAIGTPRVVASCLELIKKFKLVDDVVSIAERDIRSAMSTLHLRHNVKVEGAAAASFAAAINSKFKRPMALLTGQNVNQDLFNDIISENLEF